MDLTATIDELRREKEKLEQVIVLLEELQAAKTIPAPQQKRRGGNRCQPNSGEKSLNE